MTGKLPNIGDIMVTNLVTFSPDQEILSAMDTLIACHFSGAPVVNAAGQLVGMLSKKDCFRAALNASYHQEWGGRVADYMAAPVMTLEPQTDILSAAEKFLAGPFRRYPVMQGDRLVGLVSRIDLLRALAGLWR